ncbi:ligand-dependent nuclear receptor corepressor-like protein isoform X2 [Ptychodera flava]|uniref:ligand-dependent nuclear receptor corepressor-like protein isoform X2 n=1 Tax=Ptychodera flava TaxID=63121 RepID=UPI003969C349
MAAAVSCGNIRCQQERRQLRKELERGRKNLITCIGLECVAETLFGEELLKKVLPFYEDEEDQHDVQDWHMYQDCSLCSARQQLVTESLARHQRYIDNMKVANNSQKHNVYLEYMHPDILREADLYSIPETSSSQPPSHPPTPLPTQVSLETGSPQPLDLSKRPLSPDIPNGKKNGNSFLRVPSVKSTGHQPGEGRRGRPPFKSSYNSTYTESDLRQAIRDVRCGKLGTRRAAILYGIPRSTIRNHLNKPDVWKDEVRPHSPRENSNSSLGDLLEKQSTVSNADSVESARNDEKEWNGSSKEVEEVEDAEPMEVNNKHENSEIGTSIESSSSIVDGEDVDPVTKLRNFLKEKPDPEEICKRRLTMGELMNDSTYTGMVESISDQYSSLKNKRGSLNYANEIKFPFPPNVFRQLIEQRVVEKQEMQRSEQGGNSTTPLKVPTYKPLNPLAGQSETTDKSKPSLLKDFGPRKNSYGDTIVPKSQNFVDITLKRRRSEELDKPQKQSRPKRGRYRCYDRDNLVQAVEAVQRGEMTVTRAGNVFGVPHSTLEYKVKERHLQRPSKRASRRHRDFSAETSSSSPSTSPKSSPTSSSLAAAISMSSSLATSVSSSFIDRSISAWSSTERPRLVPSILRKNRSQTLSNNMPTSMFTSLLDRPPLLTVSGMDESRRIQEVMEALRGGSASSRSMLDSATGQSSNASDCFIVGDVHPTSPTDQPRSLRDLFDRHAFRYEKHLSDYGPLSTVDFDSSFKAGSSSSAEGGLGSFLQKESAKKTTSKSDADKALHKSAIESDTSAIYQQSLSTTIDTALRNIMSAFHRSTSQEHEQGQNKSDAKETEVKQEKKEANRSDSNGKFLQKDDDVKSNEFKAKLRRSFEKTAQDIGHEMLLYEDKESCDGEETEFRKLAKSKSSDKFLK